MKTRRAQGVVEDMSWLRPLGGCDYVCEYHNALGDASQAFVREL